jgi:hypothetical protein
MASHFRNVLIGGLAAVGVAFTVGVVLVVLPLLPFTDRQARQRWEQLRPAHYEVDVTWASGWRFGSARVELRDGALVRGVDLDNGQPLDFRKRQDARYFASIDNLFKILDERLRPAWYWRVQLARHYPQLASRLSTCVAPLSSVSYDAEYGYPTDISYNDGWCANTFFTYSNVKITRFRPLP